jgi:hypothetical protein
MEIKSLQVIYYPGCWGNAIRWMLDRFSKDSKFMHLNSPWDKDNRVHDYSKNDYQPIFKRSHQLTAKGSTHSPDPTANKIIITYNDEDTLWIERLAFYRTPGGETEESRYKKIIGRSDPKFVKESFGITSDSKSVAKELLKIQFHDVSMHKWWNSMKQLMTDTKHYKLPVYSMLDENKLCNQLQDVSDKFSLALDIDPVVIRNVVERVKSLHVVQTKDRVNNIMDAIQNQNNIKCGGLDIVEQAFIETELEKIHDSLLFPYGTNWFSDTAQINEFINTYPSYLKHMNPRLPWYNNIKNPYHVKNKIDRSR